MTNPGAGATMNDLSSDTEIRQSQFMLEPASEKDNYPGLENAQPSFPDATKHVAKCNSVADYDEKRRAQGPRGNNGDDSYDRAAQSGCNKQLSTDAITFKEKDVMNPSWDLAEALRAPVDGGGDLHRNRVPFPLVAKSPNKPLPETSEAATEKGIRTDDSSTLDAKTSDEQTSGLGRIILPNAALLRGFEYFRNCVPPLRPIISPLMPRRDVGFAIISKIEAESLDAVRYTEAAINEGNMIYFFKSLVPAAFKDNTTFVDKIRDINTPLGDLENLLQSWPNFFVGVRQIQVETPYLAVSTSNIPNMKVSKQISR